MKNNRNYRKTLRYKIWRFFDQLTWEDIKKVLMWLYEDITAFMALVALFIFIFIIPHLFH